MCFSILNRLDVDHEVSDGQKERSLAVVCCNIVRALQLHMQNNVLTLSLLIQILTVFGLICFFSL